MLQLLYVALELSLVGCQLKSRIRCCSRGFIEEYINNIYASLQSYDACLPCRHHQLTLEGYPALAYLSSHVIQHKTRSTLSRNTSYTHLRFRIWTGSRFSFSQPSDHWSNPPFPPHTPAPQSTLPSATISCTSIAETEVSHRPPTP